MKSQGLWVMMMPNEMRSPIDIASDFMADAPVDLLGMAAALGLQVVHSRDLPNDVSGKIERAGRHHRITLNGHDGQRRQRFTLAHELAHYILHRDLIGDGITDSPLYRSRLSDDVEMQANRFAADLLMPRPLVARYWREGVKSFAGMAEKFDVSHQVAEIRMRNLRLGA